MTTTIGFIGLGVMGAPMAENLVKAGFDVIGHTRRPGGADRLIAAGGRGSTSIAEVSAGADVVITVLPDSPDVTEVVTVVLEHARPGLLIIDMSTISPQVDRALA